MTVDDDEGVDSRPVGETIRQLTEGGAVDTTYNDRPYLVHRVNRADDPPTAIIEGPKGGIAEIRPAESGGIRVQYRRSMALSAKISGTSETPPEWADEDMADPTIEDVMQAHRYKAKQRGVDTIDTLTNDTSLDLSEATIDTAHSLWEQVYDNPDHEVARVGRESCACVLLAARVHDEPVRAEDIETAYSEHNPPIEHSLINTAQKVSNTTDIPMLPPPPTVYVDRIGDIIDAPHQIREKTREVVERFTAEEYQSGRGDVLVASAYYMVGQAMGSNEKIPTDVLLSEIRRLADGNDPPTTTEMHKDGAYSPLTYWRRFGSWNEAVVQAFADDATATTSETTHENFYITQLEIANKVGVSTVAIRDHQDEIRQYVTEVV